MDLMRFYHGRSNEVLFPTPVLDLERVIMAANTNFVRPKKGFCWNPMEEEGKKRIGGARNQQQRLQRKLPLLS